MIYDRKQRSAVEQILKFPELYPDEFKSWVVRWVNNSPFFQLASSQLPSLENTHYIGGSGEPVFSGTWANYGSGYESAGFYKDPFGRVFLCGEVAAGTAGTTIFTLPGGYRPKNRERFGVDGNSAYAVVDVSGNGDVIHVTGSVTSVQLGGISFRAFS